MNEQWRRKRQVWRGDKAERYSDSNNGETVREHWTEDIRMAERASVSRTLVLTPAAQREADMRKVRTIRMGPRGRRFERQAERGMESQSRTTRSPVDWHRKFRLSRPAHVSRRPRPHRRGQESRRPRLNRSVQDLGPPGVWERPRTSVCSE